MDFLALAQNSPVSWVLLVLLLLLTRKLANIIWVIAVSSMAESLSRKGYDVVIGEKGVSLARSKPSCRRPSDVNQKPQKE